MGIPEKSENGVIFNRSAISQESDWAAPAVMASLGNPELTVAVEAVRGHVIRHPSGDLCIQKQAG